MAKVTQIDIAQTGCFSPLFVDYTENRRALQPFIGLPPVPENFIEQSKQKKISSDDRKILSDRLRIQYGSIKFSSAVEKNLQAILSGNTFTLTTGHQLNIFSGPLYFIYKIVTVINAAQKLNEKYPSQHFVPVFWMASEDHDKEEIDHFTLFGKKYTWETEQEGPVGRFLTSSMNQVLSELPEKIELFEKAYLEHKTLSEATRFFVNELFGEHGLLIIDGDDPVLKKRFIPVMREELLQQSTFDLVMQANRELEMVGYDNQAFARKINLFYIGDGNRRRIEREEMDGYRIVNTDIKFSETEMLNILDKHPEHFSPNVLLRPLYQETILPNVSYTGGPAEVAYWMQLHEVFSHHKIPFPILLPRNMVMFIPKNLTKKLDKLGITEQELFSGINPLKQKLIAGDAAVDLELAKEEEQLAQLFKSIDEKASTIDASLKGFVQAENQKATKQLDDVRRKIRKAQEKRSSEKLTQLQQVYDKLFPEGELQERTDNFLNYYLNNPAFIKNIMQYTDPFDRRFLIIKEDE